MKIVDEIVKDLDVKGLIAMLGDGAEVHDYCCDLTARIIAAKLEPVKHALLNLSYSGGAMEWLGMHTPQITEDIEDAIALFEDA